MPFLYKQAQAKADPRTPTDSATKAERATRTGAKATTRHHPTDRANGVKKRKGEEK